MKRLLPLVLFFVALFVAPHAGAAPEHGHPDIDEECSSNSNAGRDNCRQQRDSPEGKPPHGTPYPKVWSVHTSSDGPGGRSVCVDQLGTSGGDLEGKELVELARQQCNRHNVILKKNLVTCFEKGIWTKTNKDPAEACPKGKEVAVHEIGDDALCEMLNNPIKNMDPGNGIFNTCEATGPGPEGWGEDDSNPPPDSTDDAPPGCCRVMNVHNVRHGRGFELADTQSMSKVVTRFPLLEPKERLNTGGPPSTSPQRWDEDYFTRTETHEIWMCNPQDTPDNVTRTHYYCAETSQDIMVEGWQNPAENSKHRGAGWCNVTTGYYQGGGEPPKDPDDPWVKWFDIDQVFGDMAKAFEYIGEPKGIIDPTTDRQYREDLPDDSKGPWMCHLKRKAFNEYCSDAQIVSTNQLAHSMGAIAQSVWGIPIDFFGGSVVGPPDKKTDEKKSKKRHGGMRNNCDLVPHVVDFAHPYAIYLAAKTSTLVASKDDPDKKHYAGQYRFCNGTDITTDCVRRLVTPGGEIPRPEIEGNPLGPEECGPNGIECRQAAWCDWNPYAGPGQERSGRAGYAPSLCRILAIEIIVEAEECIREDGVSKAVSCLMFIWNSFLLMADPPPDLDDHAFDDPNDWGGYRVLTKPNWDVPRREHDLGSVVTHVGPSDPGVCENDSMSVPDWHCDSE